MIFIATLISRIFEPAILISIVFLVTTRSAFWLFVIMGPILGYRLWLKRKQNLDWDITDRKKRVMPLLFLCIFLLSMTGVVRFFEPRLFPLSVLFLTWALGFFLITLKYKISGHVAVATLAAHFWPPAFIVVPFIAWSRVVLKKHTLGEVISGFLYSLFLLVVFDYF